MKSVARYVLPALVVPGAFGYCLWGAQSGARGWEVFAHAACLGIVVPFSGIAGGTLIGLALVQRLRGRPDWRWVIVAATIVGGPAVVALANVIGRWVPLG